MSDREPDTILRLKSEGKVGFGEVMMVKHQPFDYTVMHNALFTSMIQPQSMRFEMPTMKMSQFHPEPIQTPGLLVEMIRRDKMVQEMDDIIDEFRRQKPQMTQRIVKAVRTKVRHNRKRQHRKGAGSSVYLGGTAYVESVFKKMFGL